MTQPHDPSTEIHDQPVDLSFHYPVVFTRHAFAVDNSALADVIDRNSPTAKTLAFIDSGVADKWPGLREDIASYAAHHGFPLAAEPLVFPGGEAIKDGWPHAQAALDLIQRHRLCRHSYVLAIGGGAFLDAIGFAASLVHRGVRLVRLPTTTLAQDDSGVGVKNGINLAGQKNLVGVFAPPYAVVNDAAFLQTLSREVMLDGIAEAFKVAIIKDADFFGFLSEQAEAIAKGDLDTVAEAVRRSALLHMDHIRNNGDPFELGEARPLDFGHWAAHRLEAMSDYAVRHGQGVSVGIAVDAQYACVAGFLSEQERDAIHDAVRRCGMPLHHPLLDVLDADGRPAVLQGIEQFREHLGGRLTVTFPQGIGARIEVNEIDEIMMVDAIKAMRFHATADES